MVLLFEQRQLLEGLLFLEVGIFGGVVILSERMID